MPSYRHKAYVIDKIIYQEAEDTRTPPADARTLPPTMPRA
jgi:hypothetical protein